MRSAATQAGHLSREHNTNVFYPKTHTVTGNGGAGAAKKIWRGNKICI